MKHIGIIAEYNPFHNGHAYQLNKAKELFPDKKIVVLMSGNYVQRGEPAIYNKYIRTQCALQEYADIVFELPLLFSCASAEHFACACLQAFHKLGTIDTLCFGAETDDITLLKEIAHICAVEPDSYKTSLQEALKEGLSFPKARMLAISTYMKTQDIESLLKQPNNILAIEYLKAIERYHFDITPVIIKRIGNDYHDNDTNSIYSSATAIRNQIMNGTQSIAHTIPKSSSSIIEQTAFAKPLYISDFYTNLQYALWKDNAQLEQFFDVSSDLANQLRAIKQYPRSYNELLEILASKQYTTTRLQRILLNILLGISSTEMEYFKENNYITYLRLLGAKKDATSILKDIKEQATIPIINKVANAKTLLSSTSYSYYQQELHRNHLYAQIFYNKYGIHVPSEYEHSVIICD